MTYLKVRDYNEGHRLVVVATNSQAGLHFCRHHGIDTRFVIFASRARDVVGLSNKDVVVVEVDKALEYALETEVMLLKLTRHCRVARILAAHHEVIFS